MAEGGPIGVIILMLVFVICWAMFLGKLISDMGQYMIVSAGLTGIEAFIVANFNLLIFIFLVLGTVAYMYFSGGQ